MSDNDGYITTMNILKLFLKISTRSYLRKRYLQVPRLELARFPVILTNLGLLLYPKNASMEGLTEVVTQDLKVSWIQLVVYLSDVCLFFHLETLGNRTTFVQNNSPSKSKAAPHELCKSPIYLLQDIADIVLQLNWAKSPL